MSCTQPIDYTSRDFDSIYSDLVTLIPTFLPEWTSTSDNDFGHVLLQLFAYVGDILNYYIDRVANEAYLSTAVQRGSILNIANMLGYVPYGNSPATGYVTFTIGSGYTNVDIPAGTQVQATVTSGSDNNVVTLTYETQNDLIITGGSTLTGSVAISEGVTITNEIVGTGSGLAYQEFIIQRTPVIDGSLTVSVDGAPWLPVSHLVDYGSTDQVYQSFTDNLGRVHVNFGDNVNGLVPVSGSAITATYRVGGGSIGNVAAGTIDQLANSITGVVSVINPVAASGGADQESNDHIRNYAPLAISTLNRAVTLADYANLAVSQTYCAKAKASGTFWNSITVYAAPPSGGVVPVTVTDTVTTASNANITSVTAQFTTSDVGCQVQISGAGVAGATLTTYISAWVSATQVTLATAPSTSVSAASMTILNRPVLISAANKTLLDAYITNRAQVGTNVTIADPTYTRCNITAAYQVLPQYKQSTVSASVNTAILSLLSFDGVIFADSITASDVYATITSVAGVDYVSSLTYLNKDMALSGTYTTVTSAVLVDATGLQTGDSVQFVKDPNTSVETIVAGPIAVTVSGTTITFASTNITGATVVRNVTRTGASYAVNEVPVAGKLSLTASGGVA